MKTELEDKFDDAIIRALKEAKNIGYVATRFFKMFNEMGGVSTAKALIKSLKPSEGYTALWKMNRLDLTVEALVQDPKWQPLFSSEEIEKARQRLHEYGYSPP